MQPQSHTDFLFLLPSHGPRHTSYYKSTAPDGFLLPIHSLWQPSYSPATVPDKLPGTLLRSLTDFLLPSQSHAVPNNFLIPSSSPWETLLSNHSLWQSKHGTGRHPFILLPFYPAASQHSLKQTSGTNPQSQPMTSCYPTTAHEKHTVMQPQYLADFMLPYHSPWENSCYPVTVPDWFPVSKPQGQTSSFQLIVTVTVHDRYPVTLPNHSPWQKYWYATTIPGRVHVTLPQFLGEFMLPSHSPRQTSGFQLTVHCYNVT